MAQALDEQGIKWGGVTSDTDREDRVQVQGRHHLLHDLIFHEDLLLDVNDFGYLARQNSFQCHLPASSIEQQAKAQGVSILWNGRAHIG